MSTVPAKYSYLLDEPAPRMLLEALKLVGIREVKGSRHNPIILEWAKALGIESIVKDDEMAWCATAHAYVIISSGKPLGLRNYDIIRALKYAEWGNPVETPELGDTLVFKRPEGGHVGLYVAESKNTYHVLGGNQSDAYGFTEIAKNRLVAARNLYEIEKPKNVRRIFIDSSGKISNNEQ